MSGLIVPPGEGRKLVTPAHEITFKATAADGSSISFFEVLVPPGFDVGAHTHATVQEFFYLLEGELNMMAFEPTKRTEDDWQDWESDDGRSVVHAVPGTCMFVPPGCPHAFRNVSDKPARMLFQCYPSPDHEIYFEEICDIFAAGDAVDPNAVEELRNRSGVTQITPLRFDPPPGYLAAQPAAAEA